MNGFIQSSAITALWQLKGNFPLPSNEESRSVGNGEQFSKALGSLIKDAGFENASVQDELSPLESSSLAHSKAQVSEFEVLTPKLSSDFAILNGTSLKSLQELSTLNRISDPLMKESLFLNALA